MGEKGQTKQQQTNWVKAKDDHKEIKGSKTKPKIKVHRKKELTTYRISQRDQRENYKCNNSQRAENLTLKHMPQALELYHLM